MKNLTLLFLTIALQVNVGKGSTDQAPLESSDVVVVEGKAKSLESCDDKKADCSTDKELVSVISLVAINVALFLARKSIEKNPEFLVTLCRWGAHPIISDYDIKVDCFRYFSSLLAHMFVHKNEKHILNNMTSLVGLYFLRRFSRLSGELPLLKPYLGIGLTSVILFEIIAKFQSETAVYYGASNALLGAMLYTAYWSLKKRGANKNNMVLLFGGLPTLLFSPKAHLVSVPATALYLAVEKYMMKKDHKLEPHKNDSSRKNLLGLLV
ncbi:rhomboid family intramembrane serine protease [candidate division WWE3 bacterium]|jgi:membrane associated rhomboid family serine protease|nr:rhomboid family intramembrane serine protease [candidate division WWE3 bacterium]